MKLTTDDFRNTARELIKQWQLDNEVELNDEQESNLVTEFIYYSTLIMAKAASDIKQ
jgi:hypothetical protein